MDLVETERFLSGFDTVECCFPDTWGVFVGRRMPAPVFLEAATGGLSMPNAPFAWNLRGEIDPVPYANPDTGFPNMHVMPDLSTLRPAPWAERTAFCLMDAFTAAGGESHPSTRAGSCGARSRRSRVSGTTRGLPRSSSSTCARPTGSRWTTTCGAGR